MGTAVVGTAVPAAMVALAASWQAQITDPDAEVGVGRPVDLSKLDFALFIDGAVTDWTTTSVESSGGKDEEFTLYCGLCVTGPETPVELMAKVAPYRQALEAAIRANPTLSAALSDSGRAVIGKATQSEGSRDDRDRELYLVVGVDCRAWIS